MTLSPERSRVRDAHSTLISRRPSRRVMVAPGSIFRRQAHAEAQLRPRLILAVGALTLVLVTSGWTQSSSSSPYKAAWIYVGPHQDGGWSQAHDQGRLYVQKALGSKVQ